MKKILLLMCAFVASLTAGAQTNLALNKTVTLVYAANGTVNQAELAYVTDGNTGTNVILPHNADAGNDLAAISIDLTETNATTPISTVTVAQDGRHATAYTIYGTNTAPATYSTKAELDEAKSSWSVLVQATNDVNAGGDPTVYTKAYTANSNTGFRYIVFVPTAFAYNISLRQICVYDEYTPTYTSFETTSGLYIYNQPQNVALSVVDQIGIPGTITNISFVGVTGGYATGSSDFTFGADFPQGAYDLIVTVGENTFTKGFGFLTATPSTTDVPTIDDASSYVIFSAEKNEKHDVYNTYYGDNTSIVEDFTIDTHTATRVKKMTYVGYHNGTLSSAKDMTSLVLDIFVTENHAKEKCHVYAENCGTENFPIDLNKGWNHVVISSLNATKYSSLTTNTTLFIRIDDAATENVVIYNVYYSKETVIDNEAPVISSATISNIGSTFASLTVNATDNSNGTINYSVKNGETEIATGSGLSSNDVVIPLTSLTSATTYDNVKVVATDVSGNVSEPYAVSPFTTLTRTVVKSGNGTITVTQNNEDKLLNYTYEFVLEGNDLTVSFESTQGEPAVLGWSNDNSFIENENGGMIKNNSRSYTWENVVGGITYGAKCVWPGAEVQCITEYVTYTMLETLPAPTTISFVTGEDVVYNVYSDNNDCQTQGGNNHFNQIENLQGTGAQADNVALSTDDNVYSVKLATSFDIRYQNGDVVQDANHNSYVCNIAVYPTGNVTSLTITPLFWANQGTSFVQEVTPNQWNYIRFNEENYRVGDGGHYALRISGMEGNTIYFDNLYYSATPVIQTLNVEVTDNTAIVTGPVTASDVSTIINTAGYAAAINFFGATITENITITPTNKNAVIVVGGILRTPNAEGSKVTASNGNLVVYDGQYYRAATDHVMTLVDDNNSQPAYDFVIDAQADGVTYTRTIAADAWVSYNSPAAVTIPEGVTVYKATGATSGSVTFTKQTSHALGANEPVILHNATGSSINIISDNAKIDLNLTANPGGAAVNETSVTQYGTFRAIDCNGSQYALQGGELKQFLAGAKIGAFRVYFTGLSTSSPAIAIFNDGETTKIATINAEGEILDAEVYNLNGRRIQNPTKGLYIVNGKKVVIK